MFTQIVVHSFTIFGKLIKAVTPATLSEGYAKAKDAKKGCHPQLHAYYLHYLNIY